MTNNDGGNFRDTSPDNFHLCNHDNSTHDGEKNDSCKNGSCTSYDDSHTNSRNSDVHDNLNDARHVYDNIDQDSIARLTKELPKRRRAQALIGFLMGANGIGLGRPRL